MAFGHSLRSFSRLFDIGHADRAVGAWRLAS